MTAIVAVASVCAVSYDANVVDVIAGIASMMPDAAYATHVVLGLTPTVSIIDTDSSVLDHAAGMTAFESGGRTYLAVTSYNDHGVQILDVTDPSGITAAGSFREDGTDTDSLELYGAWNIATFESGGRTYAAVTAIFDHGVQILDITDPSRITATDSITDNSTLALTSPDGIITFESGGSTYAAVVAYDSNGVQILNVTDPYGITAAGNITDGDDRKLLSAYDIATFVSGGRTHLAVTSYDDHGVQILDVTDPYGITAADSITDGGNLTDTLELAGAARIATFESGGHTYAAVTALLDDGVQILNITNPSNITAAGSITDTDSLGLDAADEITTFESGGHTYAAVTAIFDDGVQILDVTDPYRITAAGSIANGITAVLDGVQGITIFESGGHTYAAASSGVGVQIIRIDAAPDTTPPVIALRGTNPATVIVNSTYTEPGAVCTDNGYGSTTLTSISDTIDTSTIGSYAVTYSCTDGADNAAEPVSRAVIVKAAPPPAVLTLNATDSIVDSDSLELEGALDIAIFESGNHTYAAVTASHNGGVQILNITDPYRITAAGNITDSGNAVPRDIPSITTFESGNHTYAAVTSYFDDAVQILDVADPYRITAAGSITDSDSLVLNGTRGITTFESGGRTYAAVAAHDDNGVQILDVTNPPSITAAGSITDGGSLELRGARGITTFESGGRTYAAVTGNVDDGVQILDVTDPYGITAAGRITDGGITTDDLELFGANGITTFESGGRTYAAVTGNLDDGVQILDVTDPYGITAAGSITNADSHKLGGASGIATFESGGRTYAAVAAFGDAAVQILDVTYPHSITAAGSITNGGIIRLSNPSGIATFESGGSTYLAVAALSNSGVQILRVDIALSDTTPPVITITPPHNATITVGDTYADEGVVCTDDADAAPVLVSNSTVATSTPGTHVVGYTCTDDASNEATPVPRIVIVKASDAMPPVITLEGFSTGTITVNDAYVDAGATCTDEVDGAITPTSSGTVDPNQVGTYVVTYSCTNMAGITATASRTVTVQSEPDVTPPVITLEDFSPVTITLGNTYSDDGATCTDIVDDSPTLTSSGIINTGQAGTYMITYSCTDAAGNAAESVSRTVTVQSEPGTTLTVDAGSHQIVNVGDTVILSGNATGAPQDSVTYMWTQTSPASPQVPLVDATTSTATFTAPQVSETTTFVFTLTATAGTASASGLVAITVMYGAPGPAGLAVHAESLVDAREGDTVTLSGRATGAQQDTLTYMWVQTPSQDPQVSFYNASARITTFTAPQVNGTTTFVFTLTATNGTAFASDTVGVRVIDAAVGTGVLTAHAETYHAAYEGDMVSLSGRATGAQQGSVTYMWTQTSPASPQVPLGGAAAQTVRFPAPQVESETVFTFALNVTDGTRSATDSVTVTVLTVPDPAVPEPGAGEIGSRSRSSAPMGIDDSMTIDGQRYDIGSRDAVPVPHGVTTGKTTDIEFAAYSTERIIHFTMYLNLHEDDALHSDSDTYIRYDQGAVRTHDPRNFISDASILITGDGQQPNKKIIRVLVEFEDSMGVTDMILYAWNEDRRSAQVRIYDILDVMPGYAAAKPAPPDPEPGTAVAEPAPPDPEPGTAVAEPAPPDPEPGIYDGFCGTQLPAEPPDAKDVLFTIRAWSGFERGSVTDGDLLQALNLGCYEDTHIPKWVMTELAVLVSQGGITADEFVTALAYVLENAL